MEINKNNAKLFLRGAFNPFLVNFFRREYNPTETILISGCNRSGTTWLAELLATIPGTGILFEPLHVQNMPEAKKAGYLSRNYHDPHEHWPEGKEYLNKIFNGKILTSWTTSHLPISRSYSIERWIVKDINTNPMLGWIINNFEIAPPIVLIRHPCAVLASIIKRGWGGSLSVYLKADQKFRIRNPQFEPVFRRLKTIEEVFTARWCIDYLLPLSLPQPYPFELVSYEQLVTKGPDSLVPIFSRLGVDMPRKLEEIFDRPSAKASANFNRNKRRMLSKWSQHLSKEQINKMLVVVSDFGLDFYSDDPEPDYGRLFSDKPLGSSSDRVGNFHLTHRSG